MEYCSVLDNCNAYCFARIDYPDHAFMLIESFTKQPQPASEVAGEQLNSVTIITGDLPVPDLMRKIAVTFGSRGTFVGR
jgi:hypothetical protein